MNFAKGSENYAEFSEKKKLYATISQKNANIFTININLFREKMRNKKMRDFLKKSENIFAKQISEKFFKKSETFCIYFFRTEYEKSEIFGERKCSRKIRIFAKRFPHFAENPSPYT